MKRLPSAVLGSVLVSVLAIVMLAGAAVAQEAAERQRPTRAENRAIERILTLEREIEALMASLPPHLRDVVRERLVAEAAARDAEAAARDAEAAARDAEAEARSAAPASPEETPEATTTETMASTTAPSTTTTPAPAPPSTTGTTATARRPKAASCTTLWSFDTDRNGRLDGLDRYWRHFYLWTDTNGDRTMAEGEVESAYERGVQDIAVALDVFIRRKKETAGEIEVGQHIVLDVAGDGFDGPAGRGADDGALVVDATRLGRGDGPTLLDRDDQPLVGFQAFRAGLRLRLATGEIVALSCPE